jgi:hypothetical protein
MPADSLFPANLATEFPAPGEIDLLPLEWNWPAFTRGDTYPAMNLADTDAEADLARVLVEVFDSSGTLILTLDSDATGITINTATAGAWDFTINSMLPAATAALPEGTHTYELKTTDSLGNVFTEFAGTWKIQ